MNPSKSTVNSLSDSFFRLINAKAELDKAKKNVPGYLGNKSYQDYFAKEQAEYDNAVMDFAYYVKDLGEDAAKEVIEARGLD